MTSGLRRSDIAFLAIAAALFASFMLKGALLQPPAISASEFNVSPAFARLQRILGDERPHPVDTDANDAVRERLIGEIRAIGYEPEIRDDFSCRSVSQRGAMACARVRNVVFRAGPAGGQAILVASHYDSVPAGPGAADDGAGLAASLEIAAIRKKRRPVRPVIFLVTDGEEAGLLGAASFVKTDPYANGIAAVINMEARGVAGPALMFQTSEPNGRDIAAFVKLTRRPFANSMATDIYRLMPNDTDMTEYLSKGPDAINLAFIGKPQFYHTPSDNLANLDHRSLAHMGATALSTLDGFLSAEAKGEEANFIFSDVFGRSLLIVPRISGLLFSLFGLAASAVLFLRAAAERPWRAAAAPLAGAAFAGALGFASLSLVDAVRSETIFWSASPFAAQAVIYLAAIAGAAIALLFIARAGDRRAILAASWFWFSAIGVVSAFLLPGASVLFGVPAALFGCAAIASAGAPRLLAAFSAIGVAAALALNLPAFDLGEQALGLAIGWALSVFAALIASLALALAPGFPARRTFVLTSLVSALVAALALALTVNAYSPDAPRALNIQHVVVADTKEAYFSLSPANEKAPKEFMDVAPFERRTIDGLEGERYAAPTPAHDGVPVGVSIVSDVPGEVGRTVSLVFSGAGADEIVIRVPDEAAFVEAEIDGEKHSFDERGDKTIRCSGRACATFALVAVVGRAPAEWTVYGIRRGLGAAGQSLEDARPDWTTPIQGGDTRVIVSTVAI